MLQHRPVTKTTAQISSCSKFTAEHEGAAVGELLVGVGIELGKAVGADDGASEIRCVRVRT